MSAAELLVRLRMQADEFKRGLQNASQSMQRFGDRMIGMGKSLVTRVTLPIIAAFGGIAKAAMDLEATEAKFNTVFAGMTDTADAFIRKFQELTPATTTEARNMASGIQDLLIPMGFMREEATQMTSEFMHVTGALANFNSSTHSAYDVANAMQSAIIGQYRPLAALGVQLDATTVQQRAYEMGLIESGEEVTKQVAAQVVLAEIYAQSEDALAAYTEENLDAKTKLGLLKTEIIDIAAELGQRFLPLIEQGIEYIKQGIDWFQGLSEAQQDNIIKFAALAAAVGPLLIVLGLVIKAVGIVIGVLSAKLIIIAAVVAAVVWLAAQFANWAKDNEEIMTKVSEVWEQLKEAGAEIFEALRETIAFVAEYIADIWEKHGETLLATIMPVWNQIVLTVTTAIDIVKNIILLVLAVIRGDWDAAWEAIKNIGVTVWNFIKGTAQNIFDGLRAALVAINEILLNRLRDIWTNMWNSIRQRAEDIRQSVVDAIQRAIDWIRELPGQAISWGRALIEGFVDGVRQMASGLVDAVKGVINGAIDAAKNLLGLSSPSKVFADFGANTARGFAEGIMRLKGMVDDTAKKVFDFSDFKPGGPELPGFGQARPGAGGFGGPGQVAAQGAGAAGGEVNINLQGLFAGANITIGSENDAKALARQIYSMAAGAARAEGVDF